MDTLNLNKLITTLYLKSTNDFKNGYSEILVSQIIGIDTKTSKNILHYLSQKNLIDTKNGYGDNISLTYQGIEYVEELRKGKTFKTIKFKEARYIPPASRLVFGFLYWYDIINENATVESKVIGVFASDILSMAWQLPFNDKPKDAEKILLQFAKETIIEKLKEGTLNDQEEVVLMTATQPNQCPYNPVNLIETKYAEYEVETSSKLLMEEISENKLAASIIETRDIINVVFSSKHNEKLLLLNQERNLLDFFKSARTEEDFSHRLSSLGQVSRYLNVSVLRKLTNETDTQLGSVILLENFLTSINKPNKIIIDTLRQIGRIRNGYPAHTDIPDVIKGYKHFGLKYPVENYQIAWTTLLNYYLAALKELYGIFADIYLI
jgi:hypothetical protein